MKIPIELKNPTIYLGSLQIDEPITTMTDVLVASVCFYAFFSLRKKSPGELIHKYILNFFLLMGISTFLGAFMGHAFNYALNIYWKLPYWLISMIGVALLERSSIRSSAHLISNKLMKFFSWLNWFELLLFIVLSFYFLEFNFVIAHSIYGFLVVVSAFHGYVYYKTKNKRSFFFLIGSGILLVGAIIFLTKLNFGHWFNHMDISHLFMALSAFSFYLGSKRIFNEDYVIQDGSKLATA